MYRAVIFGYNFSHAKCETFIHILKKYNIKISCYIGTNKVKLNLPKKIYNKNILAKTIFEPRVYVKFMEYHIMFLIIILTKLLKSLKRKKPI